MKRASCFRVVLLVATAALVPQVAWSDVLPPPDIGEKWEWPTVALSLEGIGSVERPLTEQVSLSLWGGVGTVRTSEDADRSWGAEIAVELRAYRRERRFSGPNGAAYLGIGLYDSNDQGMRTTVTPGVKFTLSTQTPSAPVLLEPYLGVSYPCVRDPDGDEWEFPDAPLVTLGFRLVFRNLGSWGDGAGRPGT